MPKPNGRDGVSKASICKWCKEFSEGCQENASKNPTAQNDLELMKENRRLREELAEARKENLFLKKRRHSSQRESTRGISIHRRISESVCCSVIAATFGNLSECLLQLTNKIYQGDVAHAILFAMTIDGRLFICEVCGHYIARLVTVK